MPKVTGNNQAAREQLLAAALRDVLRRVGVLGRNADPGGPELLLAAQTYLKQQPLYYDQAGQGIDDDIPF